MAKRGTNKDQFLRGMKAGTAELRTEYRKFVRALTLDLLSGTILDTPVDTGLLRSNWQVSIDSVPTDLVPIGESAAVINAGMAKLERLPNPFDITIWIVNNVRYASYVEYGTPRMSPRAMLSKNILRLGGTL